MALRTLHCVWITPCHRKVVSRVIRLIDIIYRRLGRKVHNFDLEIWKAHADKVVEEANYLKFSQNEDLKDVLLETGDKILVEASPDDKIWGIGFNSEEAEGRESEWGHNGLGKALMKVRERLRGEGK